MVQNWRKSATLRKEQDKLQRAQERKRAKRLAKLIADADRRGRQRDLAFKKSGCETWEEFEALEAAESEQRQRDYCAGFVEKPTGLPNAQELANALTSVHAGGRPVRLPALLIESGRTDDRTEAVWLCKTQLGQDLADCLRELHWRRRRVGGVFEWVPPERKGGG